MAIAQTLEDFLFDHDASYTLQRHRLSTSSLATAHSAHMPSSFYPRQARPGVVSVEDFEENLFLGDEMMRGPLLDKGGLKRPMVWRPARESSARDGRR